MLHPRGGPAARRPPARITQLAAKANEGELSPEERAEYEDYVEAVDLIGILKAKAGALLAGQTDR